MKKPKKSWVRKTKIHKLEKKHVYKVKPNGKNDTGAPSKYDPKFCRDIIKFFDCERTKRIIKSKTTSLSGQKKIEYSTIANDLPTLLKFAKKNGIDYVTIYNWQDEENPEYHKEFFEAYNIAKKLQKDFLIDNGLTGLYPNSASFIFVAKNITDMRDKVETEFTGKYFDKLAEQLDDFQK